MPTTMPRTTWVWPRNFQPSQIDFSTDGVEIAPFGRRCSSRSMKIVSADTMNVTALKYSARLTWLVEK